MNEPLVSIIVPIYNSEKYLNRCIQSIIEQTYRKLDIILVNDGSIDNSLAICKAYQKEDRRIRVISQTNQGLICARITGLRHAKGDFIGFVDSDDWIKECMYEELIQKERETDADLISSGIIHDYESSHTQRILYDNYAEGLYENLDKEIYPTMLYDDKVCDFGLYCTLVNKLFKRDILCKVYEEIDTKIFYGEDCLTIYAYCLLAKSIYIMQDAFYYYIIRKDSMCRTRNIELAQNAVLLYSGLKKQFMRYENPYILMRQLKRYILNIEAHNLLLLYDINMAALGTWSFHYDENIFCSRIVIYGAGGCGQALFRYIAQNGGKDCIVAWVDKEHEGKEEQCLYPVASPYILKELEYDYLIIAVQRKAVAKQIKKELVDCFQIETNKILWKDSEYEPLFHNVMF